MINNLQISLEDIAQQIKNKDSELTTLQEVLDQIYGVGLSAVQITSLVTGSFKVHDLFKDFKPSKFMSTFMPDKYINVSKEESAIARYEKLTVQNLLIILLSYNQAINDEKLEIEQTIKKSMLHDPKSNLEIGTRDVEQELIADKKLLEKYKCSLPNDSNNSTVEYIEMLMSMQNKIFEIWLHDHERSQLVKKIKESTLKYYYINILEISEEFSEVKLWIDLEFQKNITVTSLKIKELLLDVRDYQSKAFENKFGLEEIDRLLYENSNNHLKSLSDILDEDILDNINAHHKYIESIVHEELLDENVIDGLILPIREEIYIPQSYKYFYYEEKKHKKNYLVSDNWNSIDFREEENIGKELLHALKNPYNSNQPIIILGHPGAGKSMFTSQLAYKLINCNEYVPFLIKLRDVDSSIIDIDLHINKGIQNTISGNPVVNWVNWAKKFPKKTAVIILDGFDELLRASSSELNDYIMKIQKLQNDVQNSNLNIRVILTSRLTIMQDVYIPENSLILKLNSFDEKRKQIWIEKWNEKQKKEKSFVLPQREDIDELSKEPLLLFLLALYDFEDNALFKISKENLNKSMLYDNLLEEFSKRQLRKKSFYNSLPPKQKNKEIELFRLRIGFFAQMIFLHGKVNHFEKDFDQELAEFKLSDSKNSAKNILDGFFFVHKDQSTNGLEHKDLSFEFLHKTFGEFLSADFMLRLANFRAVDDEETTHLSKEIYFKQIFSFQWIYKQPKTLEFLLEHSPTIIEFKTRELMTKLIKKELKNLIDESTSIITPSSLNQIKTFEKLKHIAIYSQNLLLLWISIEDSSFEFYLSKDSNNIECWKVFVDLWKNYGGYETVGYLTKYIKISIEKENLIISKDVRSNKEEIYSDVTKYTIIANNNLETITSFYSSEFDIEELKFFLSSDNDEMKFRVVDLIIARIDYIYEKDKTYFDLELFELLWNNSSGLHGLKVVEFFLAKGISFNHQIVYDDLILDATSTILSPTTLIRCLKIYEEIDSHSKDTFEKILESLFSVSKFGKELSPNELLTLIEYLLKMGKNEGQKHLKKIISVLMENTEPIFQLPLEKRIRMLELVSKVETNKYADLLLAVLKSVCLSFKKNIMITSEVKIRIIRLHLFLNGKINAMFIIDIIESLLYELKYSNDFSVTKTLDFIEVYLELEYDIEFAQEILSKLIDTSIQDGIMSLTEAFRTIELYLFIDGDTERIHRFITFLNSNFSCSEFTQKKINRIKQIISDEVKI